MACEKPYSDEKFILFAEASLSPEETDGVSKHIASCDECRQELEFIVKSFNAFDDISISADDAGDVDFDEAHTAGKNYSRAQLRAVLDDAQKAFEDASEKIAMPDELKNKVSVLYPSKPSLWDELKSLFASKPRLAFAGAVLTVILCIGVGVTIFKVPVYDDSYVHDSEYYEYKESEGEIRNSSMDPQSLSLYQPKRKVKYKHVRPWVSDDFSVTPGSARIEQDEPSVASEASETLKKETAGGPGQDSFPVMMRKPGGVKPNITVSEKPNFNAVKRPPEMKFKEQKNVINNDIVPRSQSLSTAPRESRTPHSSNTAEKTVTGKIPKSAEPAVAGRPANLLKETAGGSSGSDGFAAGKKAESSVQEKKTVRAGNDEAVAKSSSKGESFSDESQAPNTAKWRTGTKGLSFSEDMTDTNKVVGKKSEAAATGSAATVTKSKSVTETYSPDISSGYAETNRAATPEQTEKKSAETVSVEMSDLRKDETAKKSSVAAPSASIMRSSSSADRKDSYVVAPKPSGFESSVADDITEKISKFQSSLDVVFGKGKTIVIRDGSRCLVKVDAEIKNWDRIRRLARECGMDNITIQTK